jgi:hypothetical protein
MHFNERDFILASGNRLRQLWAERYLEFPLSSDESWRLVSYEFFRERFEKRLLEENDTALDLRPDRDEDPERPEYKARLLAALTAAGGGEDDNTLVGVAVVHEGILFRIPAITTEAHPHSTRLLVWSLNRAPVLPDQVVESVNILCEAHAAALVGFVANHGMTVKGSGFAAPNSGLIDPVASKWVDWAPLHAGFDLESCRRTLQKGIKGIQAVASNPCAPVEQGPYYPPLDNAIYSPEMVGWLRARMDREDRSRDPENLSSFQKAALTGGEGFCLSAMETQQMRSLVECPIIAAVSIDCVPFAESPDPGTPAYMMISFFKEGLEHSISITAEEMAKKRLPLAKMKAISGLKGGRKIIAADWASQDAARHLPKPFNAAERPENALSEFYINPSLAHEGFNLDALAATYHLHSRSIGISVEETAKLFQGNDLDALARAKGLCEWKIRTVRQSLTAIETRMVAGIYYTKDAEGELVDGNQWVITSSTEIDRALVQGRCLPPKPQAEGAGQIGLF